MASEPRRRGSPEEYLALERQSETKNEYLNGEIFAMAGASRRHNRITLNVAIALDGQLKAPWRPGRLSKRRLALPTAAARTD